MLNTKTLNLISNVWHFMTLSNLVLSPSTDCHCTHTPLAQQCYFSEMPPIATCSIFPMIFNCNDHTKLLTCTCPSNLKCSTKNQFWFYPIKHVNQGLIKDFLLWSFPTDNKLFQNFPIDPVTTNEVRQVHSAVFSLVRPLPFQSGSTLAAFSPEALSDLLDLSSSGTFNLLQQL